MMESKWGYFNRPSNYNMQRLIVLCLLSNLMIHAINLCAILLLIAKVKLVWNYKAVAILIFHNKGAKITKVTY